MEIKKVNRTISTNNNEAQHRERKRYEVNESTSNNSLKEEEVKEMVKEINQFLKERNTSVQYELHDELGEYFIKVVDVDSDETIREIPSKKLLELHAYLKEKLGLIFDKKV